MILVAVLAVAGIAGIAAAFFFSMRPGRSRAGATPGRRGPTGPRGSSVPRGSRPDPAAGNRRRAGRAEPRRRHLAVRLSPAARPDPPGSRQPAGGMPDIELTGPSTVLDFTGPQSLLEDTGPVVSGHRARHGDPWDDAPQEAVPDGRIAARHSPEADPGDADLPRSRRRVAWRKGTDVDEELWPAEAFGGVSDEQFWGDLAADRPLATTARTAQPDAGARKRPPQAGRLPDLPPADRGRQATPRGTSGGAATRPPSRPGPNDQTAVPAVLPSPNATRPVRAAAPPAAAPPAGSPGPSRAATGAGEDPLTSPAYALRPQGAVDGRPRQPSNRPRSADGGNTGQRRPEASRPEPPRPGQVLAGLHACAAVPACRRPGRPPGLPARCGRRLRRHGLPVLTAALYRARSLDRHPAPRREVPIREPGRRADRPGQRPPVRRRRLESRPGGRQRRGQPGYASGVPAAGQRPARFLRPARPGPPLAGLPGQRAFCITRTQRIKHGLCPRETWCGTPPGACTRRWRGGC